MKLGNFSPLCAVILATLASGVAGGDPLVEIDGGTTGSSSYPSEPLYAALGQSFTLGEDGVVSSIEIFGSVRGDLTGQTPAFVGTLYAFDGAVGQELGSVSLTGTRAQGWLSFAFDQAIQLSAGSYLFAASATTGELVWNRNDSNPYAGGDAYRQRRDGGAWELYNPDIPPGSDFNLRVLSGEATAPEPALLALLACAFAPVLRRRGRSA